MTGEVVCGYRLLRELGARALPTYAALDPKPRKASDALCIVEQLAREPGVSAEAAAEFLRDAKRLSHLHHPNVVRVRDVVVGTNTVLLVSDWIEGEALSEVERAAGMVDVAVPLAASLRVLVDLLEGLSALHELRDAKREPMKLVHAEVAPRNIVVGLDGRSVLAHPLRAPNGATKRPPPQVVGYLAPEVLLGDQTADQRADVFGAGVILWEALMGQRMHAEGEDVGEVVMRLLGGKIDAACAPPDAPWAAPLAEVAKRATAPDPSVRFANATAMLAEVRRAIGPRLAGKSVVASIVETAAGEHVRARTRALRPSDPDATQPPPVSSSRGDAPPVSVPIDSQGLGDVTPSASADVAFAPFATEAVTATSSTHLAAAPAPSSSSTRVPSPSSSSTRVPAPPTSADVVEVIELEVTQDRPSRPKTPPPFRPREKSIGAEPAKKPERAEDGYAPLPAPVRPTAQSKTDLASLALVSTPVAASGGGTARAKWTIAAACAIGIAAVTWMIVHAGSQRAESTEAPSPSSVASANEAPVAPGSADIGAAPGANGSSSAPVPANAKGPFDPQAPDDHPPLPTRPTKPGSPTPKDATPFPVAPSAPATSPQAPAPASSSPHPKKRVYDPMGI